MVLKNFSLILINLLCAIFLIDLSGAMRLVKLFVLWHTQSAVTPRIKIVSRTRWFLKAIRASKLYRSVVGYSIIHNHLGEKLGKCMRDWRMTVIFVELSLNWLWFKSHHQLHFSLHNHGRWSNEKNNLLWLTWVTGNIFLVPRHISKVKEYHVISFSYCMSTQVYVKTSKRFFLQLLVSCLLISENESRKSTNICN